MQEVVVADVEGDFDELGSWRGQFDQGSARGEVDGNLVPAEVRGRLRHWRLRADFWLWTQRE